MIETVGILGGGAWGTALALVAARAGRQVTPLGARSTTPSRRSTSATRIRRYLPGVVSTHDPGDRQHRPSRFAPTPSFSPCRRRRFAPSLRAPPPHIAEGIPLVICAKGLERGTGQAHDGGRGRDGCRRAIAGGPLRSELRRRRRPRPADGGHHRRRARRLGARPLPTRSATRPSAPMPRPTSIGVEIGGAVKNVLAIAAGIVAGRRLGASALAALVARGFAELRRLGEALGARPETLMGLSGLGDLVLTCSSPQSRNFAFGQLTRRRRRPRRRRTRWSRASRPRPVARDLAAPPPASTCRSSTRWPASSPARLTVDEAIDGLMTPSAEARGG